MFARIDLCQQRPVWKCDSNFKWKQKFIPAYTLTALDVRHDLLHLFEVQTSTNSVFKAEWSMKKNINEEYNARKRFILNYSAG